jgi:hypothetical protein
MPANNAVPTATTCELAMMVTATVVLTGVRSPTPFGLAKMLARASAALDLIDQPRGRLRRKFPPMMLTMEDKKCFGAPVEHVAHVDKSPFDGSESLKRRSSKNRCFRSLGSSPVGSTVFRHAGQRSQRSVKQKAKEHHRAASHDGAG